MVEGEIVTGPDADSSTVLFNREDTPSGGYSVLTDAVILAKFHPNWVEIDTESIPPHTTIGTATYDEEEEEVTALTIKSDILKEFGYQAE